MTDENENIDEGSEIDPNETYYKESDLKQIFGALQTRIEKGFGELKEKDVDPEERARAAAAKKALTLGDLDKVADKVVEKNQAKEMERAQTAATLRNYDSLYKEAKKICEQGGSKWSEARHEAFKATANEYARLEASKAKKENRAIDWDAVNKNVINVLKGNWLSEEAEDVEDEDVEDEDNEDIEGEDEDIEEKEKSKPKKALKPASLMNESVSGDITKKPNLVDKLTKNLDNMSVEEASFWQHKLLSGMSAEQRKRLYK